MRAHTGRDDLWLEFHRRAEDWRARRAARRAAMRRRWASAGCGWGGRDGWRGAACAEDSPHETHDAAAALKDRVAGLEKTVAGLAARVAVLERLAVADEARLAREIDSLRRDDNGKGEA